MHLLVAQTDLLMNGRFSDVGAHAHAAPVHVALADNELLFNDRNNFLTRPFQVVSTVRIVRGGATKCTQTRCPCTRCRMIPAGRTPLARAVVDIDAIGIFQNLDGLINVRVFDVSSQQHTTPANAFLISVAVLIGKERMLDRIPHSAVLMGRIASRVIARAGLIMDVDVIDVDLCSFQPLPSGFGIGAIVEQGSDGAGHDVLLDKRWIGKGCLSRRHDEFGTAVLETSACRRIGVDRVGCTARDGLDPPGIDALADKRRLDALSASLAERHVSRIAAARVRIAGDPDMRGWILLQSHRDLIDLCRISRTNVALGCIEV